MFTLSNLHPQPGSRQKRKRLGRGIGSGLGKTAGKGHKGQLARKGGKVRPGFEGGQMPLYRRLPKRGFKNRSRIEYSIVNLEQLAKFPAGSVVTPEALFAAGILRKKGLPVKLLGRGKVSSVLTISVDKVSAGAQSAIEAAGGSVKLKTPSETGS